MGIARAARHHWATNVNVSSSVIHTPDQRLRVFVSSTLGELANERAAVRTAIERLRLTPVMFELGARPYPPRELYRAYLQQSHVFLGIYAERYGWVAPGESVSGLEDEYRLAGDRPRLLYIKHPAPDREPRLDALIEDFAADDRASYKRFTTSDELMALVENDLAVLLTERFEAASTPAGVSLERAVLPEPATETVGRDEAVAALIDTLARGVRLVTLTGIGGIGKTRLATVVARHFAQSEMPVFFVPLAEATDSDRALRTIIETLGDRVEGEGSLIEIVGQRLGAQPAILVLDNLEQIAGMPEAVAALLERVRGVQVLATSRHALRILAEQEVRVDPLPMPDPSAPLERLGSHPAVRLFVDRASAVTPPFTLSAANAATVAEICRRLDGIPLAIELAAARTRVLSPPVLLERLVDRFGVLTGGTPDMPQRQHTLRNTIDWSYELLEERERALAMRLSVFLGGWTLEAAEAVCGGDLDVMETMASLLDKSLIASSPERAGQHPRFRMLETVRLYAAERLADRGERAEYERRHLGYYRDLAVRAQPFLCGPGQREWLLRLDPERANLRHAVATAIAAADDEAVIEMTWDVVVYYFVRDAVDEPDSWLREVATKRRALPAVLDAKLRSLYALTRIHHGDYRDVEASLVEPLEVFRDQGMHFEVAVTLHQLGFVRFALDHDVEGSVDALEESIELFDSIGHDWGIGLAETMLGSVFAATGDFDVAEQHYQRARRRAEKIDCDPQMVQTLVQLGLVYVRADRYDDAFAVLSESLDLLRRGYYRTDGSCCLDAAAALALRRGRVEEAADAVIMARATRSRLGVAPWPTVQAFIDDVERAVADEVGIDAVTELSRSDAADDLFDTLERTLSVAT